MRRNFLYGAATSAHQVEGNNVNNDWWEWEAGQSLEHRSGVATDHYNRYREDFDLAKQLGHNAHRLSVEWSRLEPRKGKWNKMALSHYRGVIKRLRELGLEPVVTLHHFTNPRWFAAGGGWLRRDAVELYARYVQFVVENLGDLVDVWITINEPVLWTSLSYWRKRWPPQQKSWFKFNRVVRNLARSHRRAYRVIHHLLPQAKVGVAKHLTAYRPSSARQIDRVACWVVNNFFNHRFLRLLHGRYDFIGVNYYFKQRVAVTGRWPRVCLIDEASKGKSDLGWPISPEGLVAVLKEMKRYRVPVYVTENGLADKRDVKRADFIRDHLRAVEQAQREGVDVRGYFYWSLLDNFEWDLGFTPRFGLVEVDYQTMARKVRPSALVYKAIIEQAQQS